jgi:hypothetical protein
MVYATGQFVLVVCNHNHCFVAALAEGVDDVFHQLAVSVVESMERFVEDEQLWVFDKCTCQEDKALLSAG